MDIMPPSKDKEALLDRKRDIFLVAFVATVGLALCIGLYLMRRNLLAPKTVTSTTVPATPLPPTVTPESPKPVEPTVLPAVYDKTYFAPITVRAAATRIPVIMYHDIIAKRNAKSVYFDCTKAEFAAQMAWLSAQGANVITLEQLHRHLTRGDEIPEKAIVLTFDDNYQGFRDNAYPILQQYNFPAAVFVHTKFVGDKTGLHPKMGWETLKMLDKEGLVTICSHTITHPTDMAKLPLDEQTHELTESKATLERELGHPIPFFAYPNGTGDRATFDAAQRAGYTMAFTIVNGPVEQSPSILTLNRYIHTRLQKAWEECQAASVNAPAVVWEHAVETGDIHVRVGEFAGVRLGLVRGGLPKTVRAMLGVRKSVGEFVQDANANAGINGTFFTDANLRGTDNRLIGPSLCAAENIFYPETDAYRLTKLPNRPLVLWGPTRIAVVPFQPGYMNDEQSLRTFMPDVTDIFLAGAWIVHNGVARNRDEMKAYSAADFNDPRRRAFFGITETGQVILGGTLDVVTTEKMAEAAAAAGVHEAVLLDSGFSTSIVYNNKIVVTGHTAKNLPSRPVPHAIVVTGNLAPVEDRDTVAALDKDEIAVGAISAMEAQAEAPKPENRRRRRRLRN